PPQWGLVWHFHSELATASRHGQVTRERQCHRADNVASSSQPCAVRLQRMLDS
ncbi:Docking Protein 3, partial [Manis pentadactyla]